MFWLCQNSRDLIRSGTEINWWGNKHGGIVHPDIRVDFVNALRISKQTNLFAYDAYFIECAIRNKTPFLTLDNKGGQYDEKVSHCCRSYPKSPQPLQLGRSPSGPLDKAIIVF